MIFDAKLQMFPPMQMKPQNNTLNTFHNYIISVLKNNFVNLFRADAVFLVMCDPSMNEL